MQSGQSLGPYRILEPLGAGGMGEVYLAEDTRLGRNVAIKVLPAGVAADAESLARLEQEARLLAQLEHPNVATVYGLEEARLEGVEEPVRHLVMQLAEGEPLSDRIAAGALPPQEAIEIARQVAAGVGAAHDKGIIHRDLKPANVMVADGPGGRPVVKVLDFGLAKALAGDAVGKAGDLTASPTMAAATAAGVVMGTAAYMSPEQARGKPVDRRTDVWAFGCLLYEMLTGRGAFGGETMSDIIAAILTGEPDWTALPAGLPNATARALRRCLAGDADLRPYDVRDVMLEMSSGDDGTAIAYGSAERVAAPALSVGAGWLAFAGLLLVAAVGGYTIAPFLDPGTDPAPNRGQRVPTRHTQITFQKGAEAFPSITADGDWIVYASRVDGDWDVYLQAVGGENAINLTEDSPDDDWMPALSPDGRQIAFRSERGGGGIYLMGRTGESVRRLTDVGFNPAWSPDATRIAVTTEQISNTPYGRETTSQLQLVEVASGSVSVLATGDAVQASFSPDGHWLVYWGISERNSGQRDLSLVAVDGGDPIELLHDAPTDWTPVFTPDGDAVVFSSDRGGTPGLWQLPLDPATHRPLGPPEILVPGNSRWVAYPAFAANTGQMLYATMGADIQVQQVIFDDSLHGIADGPRALTSGARNAISPDISPDGEWIAFSTGHGQQEDIYLQRIDGSVTRRLTDDVFKDRSPRFSPDGRTLAFYGAREGIYDIWTVAVDGSGLRSVSGNIEGGFNYAVWAPAGDQIAAIAGWGTPARGPAVLTLVPEPVSVARLPVDPPAGLSFAPSDWSQDGNLLLGSLMNAESGEPRGTMLFNFQTGKSQRISDFGRDAIWLADNRHVAFQTVDEIWITDTVSGETWRVLSIFPDRMVEYTSPLHSKPGLLYSARRQEDDLWMAQWE